MRGGLKVLLAVVMAGGMAACDTGEETELETFDAEEAATPSLEEPTTGMDQPFITAELEPAEGAGNENISGSVTIYRTDGTDGTTQPGDAAATTDPATTTTATATPGTAGTGEWRIEVTANGLSEGEHAWHIHSGPCGEQAPVVLAFTATNDMEGIAQPLTGGSAMAHGQATVPADKMPLTGLQSGAHSLHIHAQGGTDHGPTVACADLDGQGTTGM